MMLENPEQILALTNDSEKIIVFGAGTYASALLWFLRNKGLNDKILCVAVTSPAGNPGELLGIPVKTLSELKEYAENVPVLIATLENLHDEIHTALIAHGFANIFLLTNACWLELRGKADILFEVMLEIRRLNQKIESLNYRVLEQNEIAAVNSAAFSQYKDCHAGKDVVIVGTGPSLSKYRPIKEAVHIGLNTAYKRTDINFDFLFSQDFHKFHYSNTDICEIVREISNLKCKKYIGRYMSDNPSKSIQLPVSIFKDIGADWYFVDNAPTETIFPDIRFFPLMDFGSVAFPAIHFALFTNPSRIYLVGSDGVVNGKYERVNGEIAEVVPHSYIDSYIGAIYNGYSKVKRFTAQHYPDTQIISINPHMLKGMFEDMYTE